MDYLLVTQDMTRMINGNEKWTLLLWECCGLFTYHIELEFQNLVQHLGCLAQKQFLCTLASSSRHYIVLIILRCNISAMVAPFLWISNPLCMLLCALTKRRQTKAKKPIGLPFKRKQNKAIHFLDISRWLCPMVLNDRFSQLLISFTVRPNTCWVVSVRPF